MDIPRDKTYPEESVQCHGCGGNGCQKCDNRGWLTPQDHPDGRRCAYLKCNRPLPPTLVAVYHSDECAKLDAQVL